MNHFLFSNDLMTGDPVRAKTPVQSMMLRVVSLKTSCIRLENLRDTVNTTRTDMSQPMQVSVQPSSGGTALRKSYYRRLIDCRRCPTQQDLSRSPGVLIIDNLPPIAVVKI